MRRPADVTCRRANLRPLLTALLLACLVFRGPSASAHGILERSIPSPNAALDVPPREIVLWFNEPVDPAFSAVSVLDRDGRPVPGKLTVSEDRKRISVNLDPLPEGVYTVRWRVLWSLDGHTTSGFFLFAVGQVAPPEAPAPTPGGRAPMRTLARWIAMAAGLLLAGIQLFSLLVLRPGSRELSLLRPLTALAALAHIAGVAWEFTLQTAELLDAPIGKVITGGMFWPLLIDTKVGWSAAIRLNATFLLLLLATAQGKTFQAAALICFLPWIRAIIASVLLAGMTVGSHAAGSGVLAMVMDWIHLMGAAAMLGGWVSFLYLLVRAVPQERGTLSRALLPRLSTILGVSFGVLAVTGVYLTLLYLPALQALLTTTYGRLLLAKLLLVGAIAALAAVNRYVLKPRILTSSPEDRPTALQLLLRNVTREVGVAALVLLTVAVLTITPPARVRAAAEAPSEAKALTLAGLAGDLQVRLKVAPAKPGQNRFEVAVSDRQGKPALTEARVFLWTTKLDEDLDPEKIPLASVGPGQYAAEGGQLGLPGWWQVEVVVRRPGRPDVSTVFPLPLGELPLRPSDPVAARLLKEATRAMARYLAWREVQQTTDGEGGVVVTWYEAQKPDRLRYRTSSGTEGVIIGSVRYLRVGSGPWRRDTLPQPLSLQGPLQPYTAGAEGVLLGRREPCDSEVCQVVLWEAGSASFAAWIEQKSYRVHRLLMVAPSHYMTLHITSGSSIRIALPE